MRTYYVYILANRSRTLYVGMTNDLDRRLREHKRKLNPGFTSKYNIDHLVYYEATNDIHIAIAREKQIKGWLRAKKIALIEAGNSEWRDLGSGSFGDGQSFAQKDFSVAPDVTPAIALRTVLDADLDHFFSQQLDSDANWMAAFTAINPANRAAFDVHWRRIMADPTVLIRTVVQADRVAGYVLSYKEADRTEVSYWLGREFWGLGIATGALAAFLQLQTKRPLHARAAKDNTASLRVLQHCGFQICGEDSGFANGRQAVVEEWLLVLVAEQEPQN